MTLESLICQLKCFVDHTVMLHFLFIGFVNKTASPQSQSLAADHSSLVLLWNMWAFLLNRLHTCSLLDTNSWHIRLLAELWQTKRNILEGSDFTKEIEFTPFPSQRKCLQFSPSVLLLDLFGILDVVGSKCISIFWKQDLWAASVATCHYQVCFGRW